MIAISGLHVGLAALVLQRVLRTLTATWTRGIEISLAASLAPVVGYVVLTGAGPPAIRAALMLGLGSLGAWVGRPTQGRTILAIAAALMLVAHPPWLVEPGFQLSVAAMLALVALPPDASAT